MVLSPGGSRARVLPRVPRTAPTPHERIIQPQSASGWKVPRLGKPGLGREGFEEAVALSSLSQVYDVALRRVSAV